MPKYWNELLESKGVHYNSIGACIEVYNFLLNKYGSHNEALKKYKGINKEVWIIHKFNRVYKEIVKGDTK